MGGVDVETGDCFDAAGEFYGVHVVSWILVGYTTNHEFQINGFPLECPRSYPTSINFDIFPSLIVLGGVFSKIPYKLQRNELFVSLLGFLSD